jgi:cytochrome c-type biogenesis protein CcmH
MMRALGSITASLLVVLAIGVAAAPLPAQQSQMEGLQTSRGGPLEDASLEARAIRLADELRCPVCQGLSIHDSPSPLAQDMKDLIRSQVAAGATDQEVRQYFISKYGEWVLLEPKPTGFNILVYLLPFAGLLAGATLIVVAVRRWTGPEEEAVVETP